MMWFIATFAAPKDPSDVVLTIEAKDNDNFKDLLSQINVHTLVIGGVEDFFYPIKETADPNPKPN